MQESAQANHARHWIDGQWLDSRRHGQSIDPATGNPIGSYADAGQIEVQQAIDAASRAFRESPWKHERKLRARVLEQLAQAFEMAEPELVRILALENGKILPEAHFEVGMVPSKLRYWAARVLTESDRAVQADGGRLSIILRQPAGVAGIVVPWNSPVVLLIRSLAPALAAGASVVAKLPGQTAQTNQAIARIFAGIEALPRGVVNLFTESGAEGSRLLVESPEVPVISFTGSSATGRAISANGAARLKRFGLELGGKTPLIVFDDADLEAALPVLEKALTVFAGQFCMTGSRLLAQRGIAAKLRERLAERLAAVKVGPASDPASEMGPLIDKANVARVDAIVEKAIAAGARVIVRGGPIAEGPLASGAFYRPTLLEVEDNGLAIVQEEIFGPVLTLQVFDTEEQAIALANDNQYGLAASVWSRDGDLPLRVAAALEAGSVWVNDWAIVLDDTEEGGFKQSGLGRLNGVAAIEDFLEYKHIALRPGISR
ncbi:aldehyde dehydrogenase family protein [Pseudomonas aeruginosa]|uniref:aldehyde dehydrogenase family protein n=1 Tax=Pseudomonas aeruginosa TaxID=287 RepID=UPI003364EF1B